jgi:hypothetical protein
MPLFREQTESLGTPIPEVILGGNQIATWGLAALVHPPCCPRPHAYRPPAVPVLRLDMPGVAAVALGRRRRSR